MKASLYFFSNTNYLDFRELVVPSDTSVLQQCRDILCEKPMQKLETSRFAAFARTIEDKLFVGVTFFAEELSFLSSRCFGVSRCDGNTKTQITLILIFDADKRLLLTKELVSEITRRIFSSGAWIETHSRAPYTLEIDIEQDISKAKFEKRIFPKKQQYSSIDEMVYVLNASLISKKRLNELFYLTPKIEKYKNYPKHKIFW